MKEGTICHRALPESKFQECKIKKDGLRNDCRVYSKEYQKEYYRKNIERIKIKQKKPEVKEKRKKYRQRPEVREKERQYKKNWGQKNKDKINKQKKKYRQRPEVKEREKEYRLKYYQGNKEYFKQYWKDNPEKFGTYYYIKKFGYTPEEIKKIQRKAAQKFFQKNKNKEEYRKAKRKDRRNHRIRHPEKQRRFLFNERKLDHNFSVDEWENKVKETNGICPICNRPFEEGYGLSLDHILPVSKAPIGFTYTIDEVQPICLSCNCAKRDRFEDYKCIIDNFA